MIAIIKLIDKHAGGILCNFLALFNRKTEFGRDIKKILVVQLWGIGETILTLPAIGALRKKFPKAAIDVLATSRNKDVYFGNKNIDKMIILKLNLFSILAFVF